MPILSQPNKLPLATVAAFLLLANAGSTASAAEQTLRFKLVTTMQAGWSRARSARGRRPQGDRGRVHGRCDVFEDGRIAHKQLRGRERRHGRMPETFKGYSTYTFQNGDSLTLSYTGGWDASSAAKGDYQVVAGTGAFAGATGTGHFEAADEKWEKAMLWDGSFKLTLATQ